MAPDVRRFLLVLGDREALAWVLTEQQMAFASSSYRTAESLIPGDRLAIYTTRGCFKNPTRDRSRIIGTATVTEYVHDLKSPKTFGGRTFDRGCRLFIDRLVPFRKGPELTTLVPILRTFPPTWQMHVRRTLVPLDEHDFTLLEQSLDRLDISRAENLRAYVERAAPRRARPVS
jgi:hypothetical protein